MARIDYHGIRETQRELGINKHLSIAQFREAWIKAFGKPQNARERHFLKYDGLILFYEDYMTSKFENVQQYLANV